MLTPGREKVKKVKHILLIYFFYESVYIHLFSGKKKKLPLKVKNTYNTKTVSESSVLSIGLQQLFGNHSSQLHLSLKC